VILKIEVDPNRVIYRDDRIILVDVPNVVDLNHGCHLATTEGHTVNEFHKNDGKSNKTVLISQRGTIVVVTNR
jgi:hypothetical protein